MDTDLISEIRRARENLRHQEAKAAEAGFTLRMCKEAEKKARAELDQLLDELETGQSRYTLPGFDRLDLPAARGPAGGNGVPAEGPAICGRIEWTTIDLNRQIADGCKTLPRGMDDPWPSLREQGCDDAKIVEVLRSIWPTRPRYDRVEPDKVGRTVRGGATPAIWMGMRGTIDQKPTLEGLELAARVRTVLDLPRAPGPELVPVPASTATMAPPAGGKGHKAGMKNRS